MTVIATLNALAVLASLSGENWRYQERIDAITDRTGAALEISSIDGKSKLVFACELTSPDRSMSIQFQAPKFLGGEYGLILVRADKKPPIPGAWSITGRTGYSFDPALVKPMVRTIADAGSVYVRAYDYDGQPVDAQFARVPSSEMFQRAAAACGQPDFLK